MIQSVDLISNILAKFIKPLLHKFSFLNLNLSKAPNLHGQKPLTNEI